MKEDHWDIKIEGNPYRTQMFLATSILQILLKSYQSAGSMMTFQCRMVTFNVHWHVALVVRTRHDRVIVDWRAKL
jgi:hypothetical protein